LMGHDEAFLRAIADAPDDDATRLVYADWLEEQGESPRADYLRLECEWKSLPFPADFECQWGKVLPPDDERYPPDLRRLTEMAQKIPPGWLASVSRIGREIQTLIDRFAARIPLSHSVKPQSVAERMVDRWQAAIGELRQMFEAHVGTE